MKYLSDYVSEAQSNAFKEAGAFFAFSQEQFEAERKPGVEYVNLGVGMICPADNKSKLVADLDRIHKEGIAADLADNGRDGVILRELYNHEAFYTWDLSDVVDVMEDYDITAEDVQRVFNANKSKVEY